MVCPVDAGGGATRMSETGRPSRSLPPSGAPAAASGTGSRERDEAGVLPISDARSAGVPETAIINHPLPRNECSKNRDYEGSRIRGSFVHRTPSSDTAWNPLRSGAVPHSKRRYGKLLPRTRSGCGLVARCPTRNGSIPCAGGCALRPLRAASIVRQHKAGGTEFPIRAELPGEERSVPSP